MRIYILVDTVTEEISNMIAVPTDSAAQRQCEVRQFAPGTKANDYLLFYCGEMVDRNHPEDVNFGVQGQIRPLPFPKMIASFPSQDVPVTRGDLALAKLYAAVTGQQGVEDAKQN